MPPAHPLTIPAAILSHQTDACEGTEKAELTVRFSSPYGDVQDYVICGECGDVNGESGLQEVNNAVANFSKLYVYQGKLDNGERVMTVSCLSSGASAMSGVTANVMLPWSAVEGYDLYLVNADGTETKLEPYGTDWGLSQRLSRRRHGPDPHGRAVKAKFPQQAIPP